MNILEYINNKLTDAAIPYEYGEWTGTISYPYFVGTFDEDEYRYEDGHTSGILTLDGWSRGSKITLVEVGDQIKELFVDLQEVVDDKVFHIRYGGAQDQPSGEAELYRRSITLFTDEWKGDD